MTEKEREEILYVADMWKKEMKEKNHQRVKGAFSNKIHFGGLSEKTDILDDGPTIEDNLRNLEEMLQVVEETGKN